MGMNTTIPCARGSAGKPLPSWTAKTVQGYGSASFPVRPTTTRDVQILRYTLGSSYRDTLFLLGYPQKLLQQGEKNSGNEVEPDILPPSLSILVRMLWDHPEDVPLPEMPTVTAMRRRFAGLAPRRARDGLAAHGWLAVLCGYRFNNGAEWQSQNKSPRPSTTRLFWLVQHMADRYGEVEALRRWTEAAEAEAAARGTTLQEIMEKKSGWPTLPGEKLHGGHGPKDEETDAE